MSTQTLSSHDQFFKKAVWVSALAHISVFLFFTVQAYLSPQIDYQNAIRVDLIGLPDKVDPSEVTSPAPDNKKLEDKPEVKTEIEPEKSKPQLPSVPSKIDTEAINLDKTKSKQKDALNKLKQMNAFEKLQQELENEKKLSAKTSAKNHQIKGNQISSGSQLTGLARLQADEYVGQVEKQIKQHWVLPQWMNKKDFSAQARVRFDQAGSIISVQIVKSSGNASFDEIVIDTVQKSAPLPAPPDKFVRMLSVEGILIGFPE